MISNSLIDSLWPLIKILQVLGGFPIVKDEKALCGFKSMHSGLYFLIVSVAWLLAVSCAFLVMVGISSLYDIPFMEFLKIGYGFNQSIFDGMTMMTLNTAPMSHIVIIW